MVAVPLPLLSCSKSSNHVLEVAVCQRAVSPNRLNKVCSFMRNLTLLTSCRPEGWHGSFAGFHRLPNLA